MSTDTPSPSPPPSPSKPRRGRLRVVVAVAILLIAAGAGAALWWCLTHRAKPEPNWTAVYRANLGPSLRPGQQPRLWLTNARMGTRCGRA